MLLELPDFEYINALSVGDAVAQLQKHDGDARVIAGSTDLLSLMKDRVEGPKLRVPKVLVNIKSIPGLNEMTSDQGQGLRIGAVVTLNQLVSSPLIEKKFSILSQAARLVGTTQIRNMGSVGGNLLQRPRCMYFRHPNFICYKKGGEICYAIGGEHRDYHAILENGKCVMAHPSDMAPALIALKARVVIVGPEGEREIPLQDFFLGPNNLTENVLTPSEFLKEIRVPCPVGESYQVFVKHRIRRSVDFALSSVSLVAQVSDQVCVDIGLVLGGIAPFPYKALKAEEIVKGTTLNEKLITETAEASVDGARALPMNHYKVDLTKELVKRALKAIWHQSVQWDRQGERDHRNI